MAAKASASTSRATASPTYTSFPKPVTSSGPTKLEKTQTTRRAEQDAFIQKPKKEEEEDDGIEKFRAMTGPRNIAGGDIGALSVLNALYDSPVIRMFMAASRARVK